MTVTELLTKRAREKRNTMSDVNKVINENEFMAYPLRELKHGRIFIYLGEYYINSNRFISKEGGNRNVVVRLRDGFAKEMELNDLVVPVEVEIKVKGAVKK